MFCSVKNVQLTICNWTCSESPSSLEKREKRTNVVVVCRIVTISRSTPRLHKFTTAGCAAPVHTRTDAKWIGILCLHADLKNKHRGILPSRCCVSSRRLFAVHKAVLQLHQCPRDRAACRSRSRSLLQKRKKENQRNE